MRTSLIGISLAFSFPRTFIGDIAVFVGAGRLATLKVLWALAIFPLWFTLGIGQVQVELVALTVAAWLALREKRDGLAGFALGVLVVWKPNFLLWPVLR